jgi:hypothetical protein
MRHEVSGASTKAASVPATSPLTRTIYEDMR